MGTLRQALAALILGVVAMGAWAPRAHAGALRGVVSAGETPLFAQPSDTASVTEVLKAGDPVGLNENARQGFYYGRTRRGSLGWIRVADVRIVGRSDPQMAAASQGGDPAGAGKKKNRPWRLMAGYGVNGFAHSDIVAQSEPGILESGGATLGLELDYLVRPDWLIGFRLNYLFQNRSLILLDPLGTSEVNATFQTSAFESLIGARYRLPLSQMVRLELGVFGGLGFMGKVRAEEETGGFSEIRGSGYVLQLDAGVEIELSKRHSLFGQMGYHAFKGSQILPTFGETAFIEDSALFTDPAAIDLTGLAVMLGVAIRLPW
jgi:hypothetical protein